jgi:hypothetical protein
MENAKLAALGSGFEYCESPPLGLHHPQDYRPHVIQETDGFHKAGGVVSQIAATPMVEEPYFVMFRNHGIAFHNHAANADEARRDKTRSAAFSPLLKDSSVHMYPQSP